MPAPNTTYLLGGKLAWQGLEAQQVFFKYTRAMQMKFKYAATDTTVSLATAIFSVLDLLLLLTDIHEKSGTKLTIASLSVKMHFKREFAVGVSDIICVIIIGLLDIL